MPRPPDLEELVYRHPLYVKRAQGLRACDYLSMAFCLRCR